MAFNKDTLVVEKIKSAFQVDVNGAIMWRADQLSDPTLSCSGETVYSNDADGTPIAAFYKNPGATFSATNAVFSVNLFQKQIGASKEVGSEGKEIATPVYEIKQVGSDATTIELGNTPSDSIKYIYVLNSDKSIAKTFEVNAQADATHFSVSDKTITLPTDDAVKAGERVAVFYHYNTTEAALISKTTEMNPEEGMLYVECLFCDVCQTSNKVYGWIVFPRAKLDSNVELSLVSDGFAQPISLEAMKDYCSDNQELFHIILAD